MQNNKNIVVLGAAESGTGAAVLARQKGYNVFVSDNGFIKESYKNILLEKEIKFEEGCHTKDFVLNATEIIKSPGIPNNIPLLLEAKKRNIPVISEIEFAARYSNAKKICITGSNGKTTTTLLIYHILKNAGYDVALAGNVGQSFAMKLSERDFEYFVLEISSFQLDGMFDFKADIAIITNITPDHLDRYDYNIEKYIASKFRIIQNQTKEDAFIFCDDDEITKRKLAQKNIVPKIYPFSIKNKIIGEGAYLNENIIEININKQAINMTIEKLALQGKHNLYNTMAASITSRLVDIRKDVIQQSLTDFKNANHRLEFVTRVKGVDFINDSKATNVNSVWYAIESMSRPIIWIAGGVDKGNDYSLLKEVVKQKVKSIICLGVDNSKFRTAFVDVVSNFTETNKMQQAVDMAFYQAEPGDIVLLSPACASFDLFEDYQDRGEKFKKAVSEL